MKHLKILLVAVLFIVGVGVTNAQDKNNPWSIELGVNAVDFFPIEKTDTGRFPIETKGGIFTEYFNANDHWNMIPLDVASYANKKRKERGGFKEGIVLTCVTDETR